MEEATMLTEWELKERYNDMLDEVYGVVTIGGYHYHTSYALEAVDPIAYRVGMHEYADSLAEDGEKVEGYHD